MGYYDYGSSGSSWGKPVGLIIIVIVCIFLLTQCNRNDSSVVTTETTNVGEDMEGFVQICESPISLVYDSSTYIVYINNEVYANSVYSFVKTPYIAPNGLPFKYDIETKKLTEINLLETTSAEISTETKDNSIETIINNEKTIE